MFYYPVLKKIPLSCESNQSKILPYDRIDLEYDRAGWKSKMIIDIRHGNQGHAAYHSHWRGDDLWLEYKWHQAERRSDYVIYIPQRNRYKRAVSYLDEPIQGIKIYTKTEHHYKRTIVRIGFRFYKPYLPYITSSTYFQDKLKIYEI